MYSGICKVVERAFSRAQRNRVTDRIAPDGGVVGCGPSNPDRPYALICSFGLREAIERPEHTHTQSRHTYLNLCDHRPNHLQFCVCSLLGDDSDSDCAS